MKTVEIICDYCGKKTLKRKAEIDRQKRKGATRFFCNPQCAGKGVNIKQFPDKEKFCENCGKLFISYKNKKSYTRFCSKSCANIYIGKHLSEEEKQIRSEKMKQLWKSGYDFNNSKFTLSSIAKGLRTRESKKYVLLRGYFELKNIDYHFEHPFYNNLLEEQGFICDLYLPQSRHVVEFDGKEHGSYEEDSIRDKFLQHLGIEVIRIPVKSNEVIKIDKFISYMGHTGFDVVR